MNIVCWEVWLYETVTYCPPASVLSFLHNHASSPIPVKIRHTSLSWLLQREKEGWTQESRREMERKKAGRKERRGERHTQTATRESGSSKPMRLWRSPLLDLCLGKHETTTNYHLLHLPTHTQTRTHTKPQHALFLPSLPVGLSFSAELLSVNEPIHRSAPSSCSSPPLKIHHSHLPNFYTALHKEHRSVD